MLPLNTETTNLRRTNQTDESKAAGQSSERRNEAESALFVLPDEEKGRRAQEEGGQNIVYQDIIV